MKNNWKIVKIPEVLSFQEGPGVRKHQFTTEGVKLLNVGNINDGQINLSKTKIFISEQEAYGKYKHFLADDGDLVIASSGIVVSNFHNKIAFIKKEHLPLCMNTSTIRFKAIDNKIIDINYFKYFLKTNFFSNQLRKLITGSAQLNFGPSHLKQIDLLLPPLDDQKRIVELLDQADSLRQKRKQAIGLLDDYLKSMFLEMFGDPVKNPNGWEVGTIDTVCDQIVDCVNRTAPVVKYSTKYKMIRTTNVRDYKINFDDTRYVTEEIYNKWTRRLIPQKEDIIFTREAPLGEAAIINFDDKVFLGQRTMQFRPNKTKISPHFLLFQLMGDFLKQQMLKLSSGSTVKHLSVPACKNFKVLIPPLALQKEFSGIVQKTESIKQSMFTQSEELDNQFQALMQKSFASN